MANTGDQLRDIDSMLAAFYANAQSSAANGKTDRAKELERITGRILNMVLGVDLTDVNRNGPTFPAIDLGDPGAGLAVQVTIRSDRAKVQSNLDDFLKNDLDRTFKRLIVMMFVPKVGFRGEIKPDAQYAHKDFQFRVREDVWDLTRLSREIEWSDEKTIQKVWQYLSDQSGRDTVTKPVHLLPLVPPAIETFIPGSRDRELENLTEAVRSGQSVYIWGLGGIGKTQVAIQLAQRMRQEKDFYFIDYVIPAAPSQEAMEETILQANFCGLSYDGSQDPAKRWNQFSERVGILQKEFRDAVIIIDSFERPGRMLNGLRQEKSFKQLMQTGVQFVFTTRYPVADHPEWEIRSLDQSILRSLLQSSCNASDSELTELIALTDGHTLTVELIIKSMVHSNGRIRLDRILRALKNNTLNQDDYPLIFREGDSRQQRIYMHLISLFNLSVLDNVSRTVMCYASLLPEDGMDVTVFSGALSTQVQTSAEKWYHKLFGRRRRPMPRYSEADALNQLADSGWLSKRERLSIHPMIRFVCLSELKPSDGICGPFLNRLADRYEFRGTYDRERFWEMYRYFTNAARYLEDEQGKWRQTVDRLWNSLDSDQLELYHALRILKRQEQAVPRDDLALASCCDHVSSLYHKLEKPAAALAYGERALRLWEQTTGAEPRMLAGTYKRMGNVCIAMSRFQDALVYSLKALAIWETILEPSDMAVTDALCDVADAFLRCGMYENALAYIKRAMDQSRAPVIGYRSLRGQTLMFLGKYDAALRDFLAALDASEGSWSYDHKRRAFACANVCRCYRYLGDLEQALEYGMQALSIRERVLPADHPRIADSHQNVGEVLIDLGDDSEALEQHLEALRIREKVLSADDPDLARTYVNVGYNYSLLGDCSLAQEYQRKAQIILEKVFPADHPEIARFYGNVALTYSLFGDAPQALEYLRKALVIFEKVLPCDHPDFATVYDNLGCTYTDLGDYPQALEHHQKAFDIWEKRLPAEHPNIAKTRERIAEVKQRLAEKEPAMP